MRLRSLSILPVKKWRSSLFIWAVVFVSACGENEVTVPVVTAPVPGVAGTVISSATGTPVAGAQVSIGATTVTTGADGRFMLTELPPGPATLRCSASGFRPFEVSVTVPVRDVENISVGLTRVELVEFGNFVLYVPATVSTVRGVLIALGGPNTTAFASGGSFGAPVPSVEASLQELGGKFRALAASNDLAVLGTSRAAMANGVESDQILLAALREAAEKSGRSELASAPLLLYGLSGGGPEASGFAARNSTRVAGLFLKVPAGVETLTGGSALGVPTFVVLAELETFVDNAKLTTAFRANRRAGALWGLALEAGVPHHSLSPAQRELTTSWMRDILNLRLGATTTAPLRTIPQFSEWLGDIVTGQVAIANEYEGDRAFTSWLPALQTATLWRTFARHGAPAGFSLRVTPAELTVPLAAVTSFDIAAFDETGYPIDAPYVTLQSDNPAARVSLDVVCPMGCTTSGRVTGIAPGKATITVGYGGLTATVTVTVVP